MNWYELLKFGQRHSFVKTSDEARSIIAYHGTRAQQPITTFSLPSCFTPNVEMAKRYIAMGGRYTDAGSGHIYKIRVTYSKPYPVNTLNEMAKATSRFRSDAQFRRTILKQGYDAFLYGIPGFDSEATIAPFKSNNQIAIIDTNEFTDDDLRNGKHLTWAKNQETPPSSQPQTDAPDTMPSLPQIKPQP